MQTGGLHIGIPTEFKQFQQCMFGWCVCRIHLVGWGAQVGAGKGLESPLDVGVDSNDSICIMYWLPELQSSHAGGREGDLSSCWPDWNHQPQRPFHQEVWTVSSLMGWYSVSGPPWCWAQGIYAMIMAGKKQEFNVWRSVFWDMRLGHYLLFMYIHTPQPWDLPLTVLLIWAPPCLWRVWEVRSATVWSRSGGCTLWSLWYLEMAVPVSGDQIYSLSLASVLASLLPSLPPAPPPPEVDCSGAPLVCGPHHAAAAAVWWIPAVGIYAIPVNGQRLAYGDAPALEQFSSCCLSCISFLHREPE